MYQITCDGEVLYDLRAERYIINPSLGLELNKSGTLSFSIPSTNPVGFTKLKSVFEVFRDNKKIFEGRTLNDNKDFYNTKKIDVVGALDYFNDSIVRPFELHDISVSDFLRFLINNHNSQVDEFKKFKLGNVDVVDFDGEETLYRKSEEYKSTWGILKDRCIDRLDGYLTVRYVGNDKYLDYTQKSGAQGGQMIEFGRNLLDLTQYTKGEDIKTCIIPLGKDGLTISEINDGKDYICDKAAVSLCGWIWDTVKFDDVTVASNLMAKGQAYLKSCVNLAMTIELSAVDLNLINKSVDSFKLGEYPLVVSKPHGLEANMQISKMSIRLDNPSDSKITLGNVITGFTDKQIDIKKQANKVDAIQTNVKGIETDVKQNTEDITGINGEITTIDTNLKQTNKDIEKQRKYIILGV